MRQSDSLGAVAQSLDQLLISTRDAVANLDPELEHVLVDASESGVKASLLEQIESRRNCLRAAQYSVVIAGKPQTTTTTTTKNYFILSPVIHIFCNHHCYID